MIYEVSVGEKVFRVDLVRGSRARLRRMQQKRAAADDHEQGEFPPSGAGLRSGTP